MLYPIELQDSNMQPYLTLYKNPDQLLRRQVLYPIELQGVISKILSKYSTLRKWGNFQCTRSQTWQGQFSIPKSAT